MVRLRLDRGESCQGTRNPPSYCAQALVADVAGATPPSFVHHFGDLSYACGFLQTWDEYLWMVSQFSASVPYLVRLESTYVQV